MMFGHHIILLLLLLLRRITATSIINTTPMNVGVAMSSVLVYNGHNYSALNAIDGKVGRLPDDCNCCSSTADAGNEWWQIDLGAQHMLDHIIIYGRSDYNNFYQNRPLQVSISNGSMRTTHHFITPNVNVTIREYTTSMQFLQPQLAQLVKIQKNESGIMTICEVEIYEREQILTSEMTTTVFQQYGSCSAEKALDNTYDTVPTTEDPTHVCLACSVDIGTERWWKINFKQKYLVEYIQIFGRITSPVGQSENLDLYINNDTTQQSDQMLTHISLMDSTTHSYLYNIGIPKIFNFLKITGGSSNALTLCEVKAFAGSCKKGQFGVSCLHICHCADKHHCDGVTGHCKPPGCEDGWMGDSCDQSCASGTFGPGCVTQCHCLNNKDCNYVNGTCPDNKCEVGWGGLTCSADMNIIDNNTMTPTQSHTYSSCDASKAIDGTTTYEYKTDTSLCASCSAATPSNNTLWWSIDLKEQFLVEHIRIYGRSLDEQHQSDKLTLFISNSTIEGRQRGINISYIDIMDRNSHMTLVHLDKPRLFSVLEVRKEYCDNCAVTLCEVQMYEGGQGGITRSTTNGKLRTLSVNVGIFLQVMRAQRIVAEATCVLLVKWTDKERAYIRTMRHFGQALWGSVMHHVINEHTWQLQHGDNGIYHCLHGDLTGADRDKPWLHPKKHVHILRELLRMLLDKRLLGKVGYYLNFRSTADLDGFHQHILMYCAKRFSYTPPIYRIRNLPAAIDHSTLMDKLLSTKMAQSDCTIGHYGDLCSNNCHCSDQKPCDTVNGHCTTLGCMAGWQGLSCNEKCNDGNYGPGCNETCGHCKSAGNCNNINGNCENGCAEGYKYSDPLCNTECDDGRYGDNCSNSCGNCFNKDVCNKSTGECPDGCEAGFDFQSDPLCKTKCNDGHYGFVCNETCGNCKSPEICNNVNGSCKDGCAPGYNNSDTLCQTECNDGNYGYGCNETCGHCKPAGTCKNVNGSCENGCAEGYKYSDPLCKTECDNGKYGDNCINLCGSCFNESVCNKGTGECPDECEAGFDFKRDRLCNTTCSNGLFGYKCEGRCGSCKVNDICNSTDGVCPNGCADGYNNSDIYCYTACNHGYFGQECEGKCHCRDNANCTNANGTCPRNMCAPGWRGSSCSQVCPLGRFGTDCNSPCHCNSRSVCDHVYGNCSDGMCALGYRDHNCSSTEESTQSDQTGQIPIGGVIGGVLAAVLVVVAGIAGFMLYRRYTGKSRQKQPDGDFSKVADVPERSRLPIGGQAHVNNAYSNIGSVDPGGEAVGGTVGEAGYYSFEDIKVQGIKIHDLWDYIREKMKDDCDFFVKEFMKLPQGLQFPHSVADDNKGKNRYKEMYAYDHSRVPLKVDTPTESEYINACYVNGFDVLKKYIASQGPTKAMIVDFWRMVWQENSEKIVMLTKLIEMATQKCLQYWPDTDEECSYGNITIKLVHVETFDDYVVRTLDVSKNANTRRIRQFHFRSWPDKDVPDNAWCLVDFWRAVGTNAPSNAGPIVVHCSAGVGRTGTFIALDNLVSQAKAEGCVRPLQIVETLRRQRVSMVQTKDQFVYVHEALAEALLMGTHHIVTKQFPSVYKFMIQKEKESSKTRVEEQFALIARSLGNTDTRACEYSNVELVMAESDAYRPRLKKMSSNFEQCLGAYFLPNFDEKCTFLVTMSPKEGHLEEFWSLVEEQHIITMIMLTSMGNSRYRASSTLGGRSGRPVGKFAVNQIQEKKSKSFTERSFSFRDMNHEDEDYLTTVKQFEYTAWKEGSETPEDTHSMLGLLDAVQRWQPHLAESKPILIHCSNGFERSGIVAALLNELQRIKRQNSSINIVATVKTMKQRNKNIIHSHEQYRYCYDVLEAYLTQTEVYQNI